MDRTVSELRSMIKLANLLLEVSGFDFDQQILSGLRTRNFITVSIWLEKVAELLTSRRHE